MAATKTNVVVLDSEGNRRKSVIDYTLDNSYATGGYSAPASDFGLTKVDYATVNVLRAATGLATAEYDTSTSKILARQTTGAETANATDLTNARVRVTAFGTA